MIQSGRVMLKRSLPYLVISHGEVYKAHLSIPPGNIILQLGNIKCNILPVQVSGICIPASVDGKSSSRLRQPST